MNLPRLLPKALALLTLSVTVFAQSFSFEGQVVRVVSGDTVEVMSRSNTVTTVKCLGFSAPVMSDTYGPFSQQRMAHLALDQRVTIESKGYDLEGRVLGKIYVDGRDVCLQQLALGSGWQRQEGMSNLASSDRDRYADAQNLAKSKTVGVWGDAAPPVPAAQERESAEVHVGGYFTKDGKFVYAQPPISAQSNSLTGNSYTATPPKQSKKAAFLKGLGIVLLYGSLLYLDAKANSYNTGYNGYYYNGYHRRYYRRYNTGYILVRCNDGEYHRVMHRQGACSWHGGIAPGW